jgi:hypothetical protein
MATWVDEANNGMIETTWRWQGDRMMGTIRNGGNNDAIIGMVITNDDKMTKTMTCNWNNNEEYWGWWWNNGKDGIRMRKIPRNNENDNEGKMKANEGWWGMVGQHGGVVLGRKKCFILQTMGGDGLLKSPYGEWCLDAKKNAKGHRGIELKGQIFFFEKWTMEGVK